MPDPEPAILASTDAEEATVQTDRGPVQVKFYPITRRMVAEAMQAAAVAWRKQYPDQEGGMDMVTMERELAVKCIRWWSLPKHVSLGWDLLPGTSNAGDKIAEAVGIADALKALTGQSNKHVEAGRNLSEAGPAPSPAAGGS